MSKNCVIIHACHVNTEGILEYLTDIILTQSFSIFIRIITKNMKMETILGSFSFQLTAPLVDPPNRSTPNMNIHYTAQLITS